MPITFDMLADLARQSVFVLAYALTIIFVSWLVETLIGHN